MNSARPTRPPVRWATHSMHVLMVVAVVVGGTLFGCAFALWPQSSFDIVLGGLILAGVIAVLAWVVAYLARPVRRD